MIIKKMLLVTAFVFSLPAFAAVKNPMDVSTMEPSETQKYLASLKDAPLEFSGVIKDAGYLQITKTRLAYEMPAYWREGSQYLRYGNICQMKGESTVIFADDGFLSLFVKNNVIDKPVYAVGRIVDGGKITGLPKQMIFVIDSLRLDEK